MKHVIAAMAIPSPPIRSGKADPSQAPAANFNKTNEPFWADEKTHAES
ncbi:hypothetical protein [Ectopseudomonas khazarica]